MNCAHPILVSDFFNHNNLVTRETAILLIEKAISTHCSYIEIDFAGISFISRSFADQFHKEKLKSWEQCNKEIVVVNAHHDVLEMFKAVSKTQHNEDRLFEEYPKVRFENRRSLKQYLYSI